MQQWPSGQSPGGYCQLNVAIFGLQVRIGSAISIDTDEIQVPVRLIIMLRGDSTIS